MKNSIEIGKIIEGALKNDQIKVKNYLMQLIEKLKNDGEEKIANKFEKLLTSTKSNALYSTSLKKEINIPVDEESRTSLADIIYPEENEINLVLSENNFKELESFILSYKNSEKLNSLGLSAANTLLLYGPPGCGKTKCAYKIAKELKLPLVIARLDSLISSYLGTTAKNIRMLFEFIQKMPCVLFLDEFDAIAKARDDTNELGELKRVVNSLLQNIDSVNEGTLIIAATNHEKLLDSAVWRRFDYKMEIEFPDKEAISKMIDIFIGDTLILNPKEKKEIINIFMGLSGANIEEIIKKAKRNSVIYNKKFEKIDIYNELFIFKGIVIKSDEDQKQILEKKVKFLRDCSEKIFSYSVIAEILQLSKTKVASLAK